jgi:hypothetical protein
MFSVIKNIYNEKTKGPNLMELFTATEKLNKFFITRDVRSVHHGLHGTHRHNIQVLATHASTWVHRYPSLLQSSVPRVWKELEYRIDVCPVTRGAYTEHL